jgi:hypothetical protein
VFNLLIFETNKVLLPQIHDFMKKYIYLFISVFVLASCTEDVRFNNPAFQALKDNIFWRAQSYEAQISQDNRVVITGFLGYEKIGFQLPSAEVKTYTIGSDNNTGAFFYNEIGTVPSVYIAGVNMGSGQITITEYDIKNKTISGTFNFNALKTVENDSEKANISFTEGVFYKVPVTLKTVLEN